MKHKKLGHSDITVSPLCLGGNTFGWTTDEKASFDVLDAFVAAGGNFIDTADVYSRWVSGHSGGESETILGNWIKSRNNRSNVVIATKVGNPMGPNPGDKGLSRSHILAAVEASLARLKTDYIDLYQSHVDDPDTPVDETLEAYDRLVQDGKVRLIGASNFSAQRLSESLAASRKGAYARYETLQPLFNLIDRHAFEGELEKLCLEKGISVISYSSLASGFLSGKYKSGSPQPTSPRAGGIAGKYMNDKGNKVLAAVEKIAAAHNVGPVQVSLAWLLARPSICAPIVSATSRAQLAEIVASTELPLGPSEIKELDQAGA